MNIKEILKATYPHDSAGGRMTEKIPTCFENDKVFQIKEKFYKKAKSFETISYVYVVDKENKLKGVASIKDVFQAEDDKKIKELMKTNLIKVSPRTHQEKVAVLSLEYNIKAIPVVGLKGTLLGAVPSDVILSILDTEFHKDTLRFAGIESSAYSPSRVMKEGIFRLTRVRIPWLIIGLFGGMFAAKIATFFEGPLAANFALVAFTPLIVYMADALGAQSQTLIVRNLAMNLDFSFKKYLIKELKTCFLIAFILAIILGVFVFLWYKALYLTLILSFSLFFTVICAAFVGSVVPFLLYSLNKDPAVASGPFATVLTDILSLVIYFSVASLLLRLFLI